MFYRVIRFSLKKTRYVAIMMQVLVLLFVQAPILVCGFTIANSCGTDGDWETIESNTTEPLSAIWGFDDDDIWAVAETQLLHYDGESWELKNENEQWYLNGLWGSKSDEIWAVGVVGDEGDALLLHYDGVNWQQYDTAEPLPKNGFTGIWGTSQQNVYAFRASETTWRSPWHWDGQTWKEHDAEVVYPGEEDFFSTDIYSWNPEAAGTSADNIIVADFGGVVRYDGTQWTVMESGLASTCTADAAWALAGEDFLVGKSFCGIYRYQDDDVTKELDVADLSPPVVFGGFWGFSDSDIIAVGYQWQSGKTKGSAHATASHVWHYDGQSWTEEDLGDLAIKLTDIWGSPSGELWVVGDEGTILRRLSHD